MMNYLCDHWVNDLFTREWGDRDPIARISSGTFTEIEARSEFRVCCFLCQTISQSSFELGNTRPLALELGRTPYVRSCKYQAAGAVLYKDAAEFQHITHIEKTKCPQLAVLDKNVIKPDFAKPEVDWEHLRQWYTKIRSTADKSNSTNDESPKSFCLINVAEACLVETDGVHVPNYAALSYVWGKSDEEIRTKIDNFESLKLPGRFRDKDVPLLFRDAFEVCSQLGIDHLWIDRICLFQDDKKRKSAELEALGRIHSKASFTIVSSEPRFINQGLPGVSQPRTPPLNISVGDRVLISSLHESSKESTWETHGWTYQEGLLSENVLVFGQDMVYMHNRDSDKVAPEGFEEAAYDKRAYIAASLVPKDEQYSDQVDEYSTRLFTSGSDKVNAFLGVLNSFGEHQYGLPNRIIDQAMLWHYTYEPSRSGPKFPGQKFLSWSRVSTVGRIEYRHLPSKDRPLFSLATWAILQLGQVSNRPFVKVLDGLQPGEQSETQQHLNTIHTHISPLETHSGYDPVALVMAANLCERCRLIQEVLSCEKSRDSSNSGTTAGENQSAESILRKIFIICLKKRFSIFAPQGSGNKSLSQVITRMKPFKRKPWFQGLEGSINKSLNSSPRLKWKLPQNQDAS
ncbi:hypothetical protein LZL87_012171 [Fusarium oxysporum]|nr:hypothetical protein LZL87_012171 [Fusarium oxysporum]